MSGIRSSAATVAIVFGLAVGSLYAQADTSTITGQVTDRAGAAVSGATVALINPSNNSTRMSVSNETGIYIFPRIPPGTYALEFTADGFKKAVKNHVRAFVDLAVEINIVLDVGEVAVTVDVTRDDIESVTNTQDASIGGTVSSRQIEQLPTGLRRVVDLLTLQPGVTRHGYVAGGRSDQANVTLDGVDINDQQTGGRNDLFQTDLGTGLRVTSESIEEFRVTNLNPNAGRGRSSGAQISMITRSGSNEWHGAGFYFVRPTRFSANSFFNNAAGTYEAGNQAVIDGTVKAGDQISPRPSISRNIFGGRLGGPIKKDRAFFFYSYEGQRQTLEQTVVRLVPMAHLGQGTLRFTGWLPGEDPGTVSAHLITLDQTALNGIFRHVGINPVVVGLFADVAQRYPVNDSSVGDGVNTGGYRWNAPLDISQNTHVARLDLNLAKGQQLFIRGNYQWDQNSGVSWFPDTPRSGVVPSSPRWNNETLIQPAEAGWSHPYGWAVGHNWTVSADKVNNFRWGFTRQAFTDTGDSDLDSISFSSVFSPVSYKRPFSRITETNNFTDDFTWIKGNHFWQFGANVRFIRNRLESQGKTFGSGTVGIESSRVLDAELLQAGYQLAPGQTSIFRDAAAALIGRYSGYSVAFKFDIDGNVSSDTSPSVRNFATQEYDLYVQDTWRPARDLTLTYGLRYSLNRPVYEKYGFQVVPKVPLGDFFDRRVASATQGVPYNEPIEFQLGGPKNGAPGYYRMDWNNLQPRFAVAWSPSFDSGSWRRVFGSQGRSTLRGGFAMTNDNFGQQLAASFDEFSDIGFTTSVGCCNEIFNVTSNPGPVFTGFDQDVRNLPGIAPPTQLFMVEMNEDQRIQWSLDATIVTPVHYTWSLSFGRSLPKGMYIEVSYLGRKARDLLTTRDVMALNNLVDPQSGMDWYTAAGILADARAANVPVGNLPTIPYFENLFPNAMQAFGAFIPAAQTNTQAIYGLVARDGMNWFDWTWIQLILDDATAVGLPLDPGIYPNMFFHPQYAALSAYGTNGYSDYHGATFTLRQRLGSSLSFDLNYTFSKSMDNASGLQTSSGWGPQLILNPLRPNDSYSVSDFDTRHIVNANFILELPIGRGRTWFTGMSRGLDAVLGGWQLAGIYRWNTGRPLSAPRDQFIWATNWLAPSYGVRVRPVEFRVDRHTQNAFADPQSAFNSFRNARAGETGERNVFRQSDYQVLDLGLTKTFMVPWREGHRIQLRWEVFNVTNAQYFGVGRLFGGRWQLPQDSDIGIAPTNFGKIYDRIQGKPRSMQFGIRYEF